VKQQKLFREKCEREFGGSLLKGKRKSTRPLSFKIPLHTVLKATNPYVLLQNRVLVERIIRSVSAKVGIKIHELAIHADHIHILISVLSRELYRKWVRTLTARLTILIPKLKWRLRPYTRPVKWGKDFQSVVSYLKWNDREASFMLEAHLTVETWVSRVLRTQDLSTKKVI
jgi:REP element-mobilizing transposase RayT